MVLNRQDAETGGMAAGAFDDDSSPVPSEVIERSDDRLRHAAILEQYKNIRRVIRGVADRLWEIADIAKLVENAEAMPAKRGPYKKEVQV